MGNHAFLFVAVNYIILAKGIIGGIERSVKYLMPLFYLPNWYGDS